MALKREPDTQPTDEAIEVILFDATWGLVAQTIKIGVHGIHGKGVRNRATWAKNRVRGVRDTIVRIANDLQ